MTTTAPLMASSRDSAYPMPEAAPVMIAILSEKRTMKAPFVFHGLTLI
jgi:hypothetical protein